MNRLGKHVGHNVTIVEYLGLDNQPVNQALECLDCFEVIIDEDVD